MMTIRVLVIAGLLAAVSAWGQRIASNVVRLPDDLVSIRLLADQGSIQAQLALAKKFISLNQPVDALHWYRRTAERDCLDGMYQAGHLLLHGAPAKHREQRLAANPAEGVLWTYRAATNGHVAAFHNMSLALYRGLGTRTNLAQAYAWMELYAQSTPGGGNQTLQTLGLKLPTDALVEGRKLAAKLKKRNWPPLELGADPAQSPATARDSNPLPTVSLKLTGITLGGRTPLAVINQRTLGVGESAKVSLDSGGTVQVQCLEIREDAVLIEVEGEAEARWLPFESSADPLVGS